MQRMPAELGQVRKEAAVGSLFVCRSFPSFSCASLFLYGCIARVQWIFECENADKRIMRRAVKFPFPRESSGV
jgi:hypothetical protein